jgi:uncharacterized membrane protein
MARAYSTKQPVSAGIFLGVGLGGFFDGIVLHQILQWHHMMSGWLPPTSLENLESNTLWDGLFHSLTYVFTLTGVFLLWRSYLRHDGRWSLRTLVGGLLLGWGLFNVVEGVIDHQILGVHHVRDDLPTSEQLPWDLGFLAFGVSLLLSGWWLLRSSRKSSLPQK